MTLDGFIAFVTLVLAVLAILPRWRFKLTVLSMRRRDWWLSGTLLAGTTACVSTAHFVINKAIWSFAGFVFALLLLLYMALRFLRQSGIPADQTRLGALLRDLAFRGECAEASDVAAHAIRSQLPDEYSARTHSRHLDIRAVLSALSIEPMLDYEAASGASLLATAIEHPEASAHPFVNDVIARAMRFQHSPLRHEIRETNSFRGNRIFYELADESKLLISMFRPCSRAERFAVYRPVGEEIVRAIESATGPSLEESEFCADKTLGIARDGMHFFDIMIREAMNQSIQWHMWLYYYPHFAKAITENRDLGKVTTELNDYVITWGDRLLIELFDDLIGWIDAGNEVGPRSKCCVIEKADLSHENGSILKSAILACGRYLEISASHIGRSPSLLNIVRRLIDLAIRIHHIDKNEVVSDTLLHAIRKSLAAVPSIARDQIDDIDWIKQPPGAKAWITRELSASGFELSLSVSRY